MWIVKAGDRYWCDGWLWYADQARAKRYTSRYDAESQLKRLCHPDKRVVRLVRKRTIVSIGAGWTEATKGEAMWIATELLRLGSSPADGPGLVREEAIRLAGRYLDEMFAGDADQEAEDALAALLIDISLRFTSDAKGKP